MPNPIFVILGSLGEYSDREVWAALATSSEEEAKELVTHMNKTARLAHQAHKNALDKSESYYLNKEEIAACFYIITSIDPNFPLDRDYMSPTFYATYSYERVNLKQDATP